MKNRRGLLALALLGLTFTGPVSARADVTSLTLKLAGGCHEDNKDGTCLLKVLASGSELQSEGVQLYTANDSSSQLKRYSPRVKALTENGQTTYKIKNIPGGCFQVRTGPNGNDKPDRSSHKVCE